MKSENVGTVGKNELIIARFLSLSTWLSTAIVLVGIVMLFVLEGHTTLDLAHFHAAGLVSASAPGQTAVDLCQIKPAQVILAGLILLILTPVMRVAMTAFLFARERDFVYVAISVAVLAIVLTALAGA